MKGTKRLICLALCLCMLGSWLPFAAQAANAGSTAQNEWISGETIKAKKTGATSFNIRGLDGKKDYQTTYRNDGYHTAVSVDGGSKQREPKNTIASGLQLDVDLEKYSDTYIKVQYTLKNTGAKAHTVRVAGYADVMIDNNDRAPICATEDGGNTLLMTGAPQNDYAFRLVATTCDTVWYGLWSMRIKECFTDLENRGPDYVYSRDSGLAYFWTATVRPGEEWSRYVLIGTGSEEQMTVEIPQIPVPAPGIPEAEITLNTGEVYLTEGDALPDWNSYIAALQGTLRITGQPADSSTPGSSTVLYTATSGDTAKTARLPPPQAD